MSSCVHPPPFKTPFPKFATSSANNECDVPYILALCRAYRFFRRHQDQQTKQTNKKRETSRRDFFETKFFFLAPSELYTVDFVFVRLNPPQAHRVLLHPVLSILFVGLIAIDRRPLFFPFFIPCEKCVCVCVRGNNQFIIPRSPSSQIYIYNQPNTNRRIDFFCVRIRSE